MANADLMIAIKAVDGASASINGLAGNLGKLGQSAQSATPGFNAMAAAVGVGTVAAHALMGAATAVAGGLSSAVKTSADFSQSMANIKATVPKDDFEQFGAATTALAMKLGKDYPLSATQAGQAMEILAQKGISLKNINEGAAEAVVQLSTATGGDLRTSATIAAVALDVFKLSGSDMSKVTDVMTGAMLRGGVSANDFGHAIQAGGTAIALAGGTIEDASIAIAAMAKAGIEGSDAGTSLKTMYMNLIPTTKAQKQVAEELGLVTKDGTNAFFDATGKVRSYEEISAALANSLVGLTDKQKLSKLETLFGSDAIRAASVAAQVGAGDFGNLGESIRVQGIAAEASGIKMNTLHGQSQQLSGSVETLALKIGSQLSPGLMNAAVVATDFVNKLIDMADGLDLAPLIDSVASAMSRGSDIVYAAGQAYSQLGETMSDIPIVGDLVNQIFQISGSSLTALAALMRGDGAGAAEALGQSLSDLGTYIQMLIDIMSTAVGAIETLGAVQIAVAETVRDGALAAWTALSDGTVAAYDAIVAAITVAWETVTATTDGALAAIGGIVIGGWASFLTEPTLAALAELQAAVADAWALVVDLTASSMATMGEAIAAGWQVAAETTVGAMTTILGAAQEGWASVVAATSDAMSSVLGTVSDIGGSVVGVAQDFMNGVVSAVAGAAGEAAGAAAGVGSAIVSGLHGAINAGVSSIAGAAANLVRSAIGAARAEAGAQSPSRKMFALGVDMMIGLDNGIRSKPITSAAATIARSLDGVEVELKSVARESATTGRTLDGMTRDMDEADREAKVLDRTLDTLEADPTNLTVNDQQIDTANSVADELNRELDALESDLTTLPLNDQQIDDANTAAGDLNTSLDGLESDPNNIAINLTPTAPINAEIDALQRNLDETNAFTTIGFNGQIPSAITVNSLTGSNTDLNGLGDIRADGMNVNNADLNGIGNVDMGNIDANRLETGDAELGDVESEDFRSDDFRADDLRLDDAKMQDVEMDDIEADGIEAEAQQVDVEDMQVDNFDAEGRASGGRVNAGRSYLVGERQAEIFTPFSDGYIYPSVGDFAGAMGGGGGGTTVINNTYITIEGQVWQLDMLERELRSRQIQIGRSNGGSLFGGNA